MKSYKSINYHPGRLLRFIRRIRWFFAVYLPPMRDVTITTRNGILTFNSKDKTTGRILFIARNHEFDEMMRYIDLLRKENLLAQECDGAVIDVGGYIGMSSTAFLLENVFKHAVAFEPSPENYRLLKKNINNNKLQLRMQALNLALSDETGTLQFELSPKNYGDHRVRNKGEIAPGFYNEQERKTIDVPAVKFDSLDEKDLGIKFTDIRLIWMDIQGHEAKFLNGARNFLINNKSVPVIMEFWPYAIQRSGVSQAEFLRLVQELYSGYFLLDKSGYVYHKIHDIDALFTEHDDPEKGATLVLVNVHRM